MNKYEFQLSQLDKRIVRMEKALSESVIGSDRQHHLRRLMDLEMVKRERDQVFIDYEAEKFEQRLNRKIDEVKRVLAIANGANAERESGKANLKREERLEKQALEHVELAKQLMAEAEKMNADGQAFLKNFHAEQEKVKAYRMSLIRQIEDAV